MALGPPAATAADQPLAGRIAVVMRVGTVIASVLLAVGALLQLHRGHAATILLGSGCGLLILLPVIRLMLMADHFARAAETRFAAFCLVVVALVVVSGVTGALL